MLIKRVGHGRQVTVDGVLETSQGVALGGQPVQLETAPANGSQAFTVVGHVTTAPDGAWSFALPAGPSRIVRAVYAGSATNLPATGQAAVDVPAKVEISIHPRSVRWGGTVVITGRVLGGYVPRSSKLLRLDIGVDGIRAIQGIPNIRPNGEFRTTYTFGRLSGRVRFWFTVSTLRESAFPWAPASSRRVYVRVR